jgi:hypothetical protein
LLSTGISTPTRLEIAWRFFITADGCTGCPCRSHLPTVDKCTESFGAFLVSCVRSMVDASHVLIIPQARAAETVDSAPCRLILLPLHVRHRIPFDRDCVCHFWTVSRSSRTSLTSPHSSPMISFTIADTKPADGVQAEKPQFSNSSPVLAWSGVCYRGGRGQFGW